MGVRGLKKLLKRNSSLFEPYKLHDCNVVIDGSNICNQIYNDSKLDWQLGGEYEAYHTEIIKFFQTLRDCGVVPYVLIDGVYNHGERKLNVTLQRAQQRLDKARVSYFGEPNSYDFLPILAMETFRCTMKELGINFAHNITEADGQCVSVANHLNCPVMSMDSDFYILNINAGFIASDTLGTVVSEDPSSGRKYLKCEIYYVARLIQSCPGFQPSMLPMIPVMQSIYGHSGFPPEVFRPEVDRSLKQYVTDIMYPIQLAGSFEQAMERALSMIKTEHQASVRKVFKEIVEEYTIPDLILAKELGLEEDSASGNDRRELFTFDGMRLPKWLIDSCCSGDVTPFSLNVAVHHRTVLLSQMEDFGQSSSYVTSQFLRRVMYGMLLPNYFQSTNNEVLEIGYECDHVVTTLVAPLYSLSRRRGGNEVLKVPSVTCLDQQDAETKLQFMASVFSVPDFNRLRHTVPPEWQLYVCILIYFLQSAEPRVTPQFMCALLLTAIYFNLLHCEQNDNGPTCHKSCVKSDSRESKAHDDGGTVRSFIVRSAKPGSIAVTLSLLRNTLSTYGCSGSGLGHLSKYDVKKIRSRFPNFRFLHVSSQFQSCLSYGMHLNGLLGQPLPRLLVYKFFGGSFLYNVIIATWQKDENELKRFLEDSLGKDSLLHRLYYELQSVILNMIPQHRHRVDKSIPPPPRRNTDRRLDINWRVASN